MAAGEELLDHGQDPVGIGEPGVVPALDFEISRTGDVVGEVPAALYRSEFVAGMDDQGGRGDRRQDRPHIDPEVRWSAARAIPGLALMRSTMASVRIDRTDGSRALHASPLPHAEAAARARACQRASCCTEGV